MEELAERLEQAGFPAVTRWEIENNYRRTATVSGKPSIPPLGAIISEIPKRIVQASGVYHNDVTKEDIPWERISCFDLLYPEFDDEWVASHTIFEAYSEPVTYYEGKGQTPEIACSFLYIAIKTNTHP
jgi:hypothetical protein